MKITVITCLMVITGGMMLSAQEINQTIRGTIVDSETQSPLASATIAVYRDSVLTTATISDPDGNFRIDRITVGRYTLVASYVGYRQHMIRDVIVNSTRETILQFELEEIPTELDEIRVMATEQKGMALNRHAFVGARTFSSEEAERYAGSRGDPARMAACFAGVQGNDDSSNDLVIRGNSPLGVLWRLEGVHIPNPNHFGVTGSTGGPVTILNNRVLSVSDFMIGAFPAEFGNSMAGVFDLRMRNGNNERHEFSGQLGFLGTELLAEGPISREKRSSYLASYRYSTLAILQALGIEIGTDAVPRYQDASFKLNFPAGSSGNFSIFGIGGKGAIDILASEQKEYDPEDIYGDLAIDEHFRTGMGIFGAGYSRTVDRNSLLRIKVATSLDHQSNRHDKVYRRLVDEKYVFDSIMKDFMCYRSDQIQHSLNISWNRKINGNHGFRLGISNEAHNFLMDDSAWNEALLVYLTRLDYHGSAFMTQPYLQWNYRTGDRFTSTAGVHGQFLFLGGHLSSAVEPRLGIRYRVGPRSTIAFGSGLHSQMLPSYIYLGQSRGTDGNYTRLNEGLDFQRTVHNVLTWDLAINEGMRLKFESYYQYLYNIPVEALPSSYSVLDEGHNLSRFFPGKLVNSGKGNNYGLEVTMERFFSRSYFLLVTASLYDASRTGSDGIRYDAVFNNRGIINTLASREFSWGRKNRSAFTVGGKVTLAGGKRYTPVDMEASELAGEAVYLDAFRNSKKFPCYFRADLKFNYRLNTPKYTHEVGLDLINVTDHPNVLKQIYIHGAEDPLREVLQLGFLPLFYYRIDI